MPFMKDRMEQSGLAQETAYKDLLLVRIIKTIQLYNLKLYFVIQVPANFLQSTLFSRTSKSLETHVYQQF